MSRNLPIVERDNPIRAYKIGQVESYVGKELALYSAGTHTKTLPEMQMQCGKGHLHKTPDPSCSCGFYAYKNVATLRRHQLPVTSPVLMEVDLAGEVREANRTYRAEHQRVICLYFPHQCAISGCDKRATGLAIVHRDLVPICEPCFPGDLPGLKTLYTLAEVSALLGIETRWNGTSDRRIRVPNVRHLVTGCSVLGWVWLFTLAPATIPPWGRELVSFPLGFFATYSGSQILIDRFGHDHGKVHWVI